MEQIADASGKTALTSNGVSWWEENSLRRQSTSLNFIERDNSTAVQDNDRVVVASVAERLLESEAHLNKQDKHGTYTLR